MGTEERAEGKAVQRGGQGCGQRTGQSRRQAAGHSAQGRKHRSGQTSEGWKEGKGQGRGQQSCLRSVCRADRRGQDETRVQMVGGRLESGE